MFYKTFEVTRTYIEYEQIVYLHKKEKLKMIRQNEIGANHPKSISIKGV